MIQPTITASELAKRPGDIGALGDATFVEQVIIVERVNRREFYALDGGFLGAVQRSSKSAIQQRPTEETTVP